MWFFSRLCVNSLIYKHKKGSLYDSLGDPGGIRTHDPQLRRLLLYPAELLDLTFCFSFPLKAVQIY